MSWFWPLLNWASFLEAAGAVMKIGSSLNPWNALYLDTLYFTNLTDLRVAVTYILKTWSRWSSSRPPTSSRRTTSARPWRRPHFWRQSKGEPDSSITQIQVRHLRTVTSLINVSSYKWIQTETKKPMVHFSNLSCLNASKLICSSGVQFYLQAVAKFIDIWSKTRLF